MADLGTHEELLARNERYRLLLTGPELEDDPDSLDLSFDHEDEIVHRAVDDAPDRRRHHPGRMAAAGRRCRSRPRPSPRPPGSDRGGGGGAGGGGMASALAATPELLAKLETLPPADDTPHVDAAAVAAETVGPFRILEYIRPVAELAGLRPRAGRARQRAHPARAAARAARASTQGVEGRRHHGRLGLERDLLRGRARSTGSSRGATRGSPAAPPSACSTACASRSSPTSSGCRSTTTTVSSTVGS